MNTFSRAWRYLAALIVLGLLSGCSVLVSVPSVDEPYRKTLSLSNQTEDLTGKICNYGPASFDADGKTQIKTTVTGAGDNPGGVEVTRALGSQPASTPLPSVRSDEGWQARGNGLNCSVLGCPSGSYSVAVTYPGGNGCPNAVILELQIP